MLEPSKATPVGNDPTGNVPMLSPSDARRLVTLALLWLATQILEPSNATPMGPVLTRKLLCALPAYQCSVAIWSGVRPVRPTVPSGNRKALPGPRASPPPAFIGPFTVSPSGPEMTTAPASALMVLPAPGPPWL